ncbi:MAG: TonB-dependent receptor [Rubrivivax sp.]
MPHRPHPLALAAALAAGSAAALLGSPPAHAQQAPPAQAEPQRIEITGSAIRRIDTETALPVQVIKREDIERTGATSTVDLLQRLAVVQGSTHEAASVGGGSFGFSGVSIHNIGETRTLVLLNGKRLAQFGGQSLTGSGAAVDLNAIPVSAIERIEVLTDGASALYGSDAIAGVVNFITKRNTTEGTITVGVSAPSKGARETRVGATKGFGELDRDGFNIVVSAAAERRTKLDSVDRDFVKTGVIDFNFKGQKYQAFLGSPRGIPANVLDDAGNVVSPYYIVNGECPPQNVRVFDPPSGTTACYFDFQTELEIFPVRDRKSASAALTAKLGDNHLIKGDLLWSSNRNIARIAPVPGGVNVAAGTPLHDQYLLPLGITQDTTAFYRVSDLGKRVSDDKADFLFGSLSLEGALAGWDYRAAATQSESKVRGNISGYPGARAFTNLLNSGLINPFVGPGEQTAEGQAALDSINFKGYWDGGTSKLSSVELTGSRGLFDLPGGPLQIGLGVQYYKEKFQSKPSAFAQGLLADPVAGTPADPANGVLADVRFGDEATTIPYSADRGVTSAFVELSAPVSKTIELGAGVRYDHYSDVGNSTTGKLTMRWTPSRTLLVRASVGTGFKAPTVPQLNASAQLFGVTSSPYDCTPELLQVAQGLGALCRPNGTQYEQFAGGNPLLKPEKSKQATIGFRLEPTPGVTFGADLWFVAIRDVFGQITEDEVFANPLQYPGAWTVFDEVSTGNRYLAFNASNQNLGKSFYSGIDFEASARTDTRFGPWTTHFSATYMLRDKEQLLIGGPYYDPIGNNAELGGVAFRWQGKVTSSLKMGAFTHTLGFNFKSGYRDAAYDAELYAADGTTLTGTFENVRLKVKPYYTFDWQTRWEATRNVSLTAGVLNLLDKDPPLSLADGGLNKGQMFGYDDRYHDPRGRTLYLNASVSF